MKHIENVLNSTSLKRIHLPRICNPSIDPKITLVFIQINMVRIALIADIIHVLKNLNLA